MGKQAQTHEKALYNEAEGRGLHEGTYQMDDGELWLSLMNLGRQSHLHTGKSTG